MKIKTPVEQVMLDVEKLKEARLDGKQMLKLELPGKRHKGIPKRR